MATSGLYTFGTTPSETFILDAYERVGILRPAISSQKIEAAQRSMNFILQSWQNKGLGLWTVNQAMLYLNNNQNTYGPQLQQAAPEIIDILEAVVRISTRNNFGGVAYSSTPSGEGTGGIAANAFDGNPLTACTQTAINGTIGYNWQNADASPNPMIILLVGVQSFVDANYTLTFSYSTDGETYYPALTNTASQFYPAQQIVWTTMIMPQSAGWFEITETGGATLNIAELWFNNNIQDTLITRMSRSEYITYQNKFTPSVARPSQFYVDRQINPVLYLYPTPYAFFNCLYFTYKKQTQDVGAMLNASQIPARFLEPLAAELAFRLAVKEQKVDMIPILQQLANEQFAMAHEEDRERVPLRVYGDFTQGWTQQ